VVGKVWTSRKPVTLEMLVDAKVVPSGFFKYRLVVPGIVLPLTARLTR
jgi:hypothetical protein